MSADFGFEPVASGERYFISYKAEDAERVGAIARCLNGLGVPVWYDYGLLRGAERERQISRILRNKETKAVILFATDHVFSSEDNYVRNEYDFALLCKKEIYVVWLDDVKADDVREDLAFWFVEMRRRQGVQAFSQTPAEIADSILNNLIYGRISQPQVSGITQQPRIADSALQPRTTGKYLNPPTTVFEENLSSDIYVDKTEMIYHINALVKTRLKYVSVSRPRRFGKTMAANMLCAYYGRTADGRHLFEKCRIAACEPLEQGGRILAWDAYMGRFDIVRLVMTEFVKRSGSVKDMLALMAEELMAELMEAYSDIHFGKNPDLTTVMSSIFGSTGRQFVIVIDEWDAVFRSRKDDRTGQEAYLDFLRDWLKDRDYVALAYMTGILPVKKYGEHSALNMFTEYSMLAPMQMARFTGFTEEEVRSLCEQYDMDYGAISDWYDGYLVNDRIPVTKREAYRQGLYKGHRISIYSPLSVVSAVTNGYIRNYWNKTETYEALAEYIRMDYDGLKEGVALLMDGGRLKIDTSTYQNDMTTFHGRDDVLTMLVHLGYLGYDADQGEVFIPNKEVMDEFRTSTKSGEWAVAFRSFALSQELLKATWACNEEKVAEISGTSGTL